jgi:HAD superfamily hydrolase (TIGR01509 family)
VTPGLVIFDCDGVLVDSEPLALRLLLSNLSRIGVRIDPAEAQQQFLGRSLTTICDIVRSDYGVTITDDTLARMRAELYDLFRRELKPVEGVAAMLDRLALRCCVASSSQLDRIRLALRVTGLIDRFEPHIFSASMVARGKPAPDLFLHAAARVGVAPEAALVIEDSPAGVKAAWRAGMHVFGFTGGGHASDPEYGEGLREAGAHLIFNDMRSLPDRISELAA